MKGFTLITLVLGSVLTGVCSLQAQGWVVTGEDLRVDPTSTKVGIGLTAPAYELDINGTLSTKFLRAANYLDNSGQALALWYASGSNASFSAGNVGIGASTPTSRLSVIGEIDISGSRLHVGTDGRVGIGTSSPAAPLEIVGQTGISEVLHLATATGLISLHISVDNAAERVDFQAGHNEEPGVYPPLAFNASGGNVGIGTTTPGYTLDVNGTMNAIDVKKNGVSLVSSQWSTTGNDVYYNSGNVGIGTVAPDTAYKLSVLGKIRAEEIVVETNWSDFVFEDGYRLMPLQDVEQHIRENKRLPDIPSAAEVQANGVSLGQMQTKLLQKVEELTLYVIELKKENEALKGRVVELENK